MAVIFMMFQSTHLHEVRLQLGNIVNCTTMFQSTHLHEVRPLLLRQPFIMYIVSIHAPTRGATCMWRRHLRKVYVSIHAPTRGATSLFRYHTVTLQKFQSTHLHEVRHEYSQADSASLKFQSTHLHEVRLSFQVSHSYPSKVSIHAPTRGATLVDWVWASGSYGFNPRTYTRCDFLCPK